MTRALHIARREWLEQARQPAMLAVIAALYALVDGVVLAALALLQVVARDGHERGLEQLLGAAGALDLLVGTVVVGLNFLVFSQFLGVAGVLCGHAVLHDRQCGTLTFLLLAPVRRAELILGKVLGAIGPCWLLYLLVGGAGSLLASRFPIAAPHAAWLPTSGAWWVAFLVGGPSLAVLLGTLCTIVSALARDVRTAQQGVWFLVFFATLGSGSVLTNGLPAGIGLQVAVAVAGVLTSGLAVLVGAGVITRDLGR